MLRPYKDEDLDHLMEIWLEGNISAHPYIGEEYWQENYPAVRRQLPEAQLLVYDKADKARGFIGVVDGSIAGLFVEEEYRGRGIGGRLLQAAVSLLGANRLHVYAENTRAIALYQRHGFVVTETRTDAATSQLEHTMELPAQDATT